METEFLKNLWAILWDHAWNILCGFTTVTWSIVIWLWKGRGERKAKLAQKAAEDKQQAAEAELLAIRRRGQAPFLFPSDDRFNMMYVPSETAGNIEYRTMYHRDLLCVDHPEVDHTLPAGSRVFFLVENSGKDGRRVKLSLDDIDVSLGCEPKMDDSRGRQFLVYPYDPTKHGQIQRLKISFETKDGIQDTHVYQIKHGIRFLKRVDPA